MPTSLVDSEADTIVGLIKASQARLNIEQAEILSNPLSKHRLRRLRSILPTLERELAALREAGGRFIDNVLPAVYSAGGAASGFSFGWNDIQLEHTVLAKHPGTPHTGRHGGAVQSAEPHGYGS